MNASRTAQSGKAPPPYPIPPYLFLHSQAESATVLRDGRLAVVPSEQLVPGDVVEVSVGGNVPADLRVASLLSAVLRYVRITCSGWCPGAHLKA